MLGPVLVSCGEYFFFEFFLFCVLFCFLFFLKFQIPLERYIGNFLLEVPTPSPGRVEVTFSYSYLFVHFLFLLSLLSLYAKQNDNRLYFLFPATRTFPPNEENTIVLVHWQNVFFCV